MSTKSLTIDKGGVTRKLVALFLLLGLLTILSPSGTMAATEEAKQAAIDAGLAYLDSIQQADGSWFYNHPFPTNNDYELAATASAALAFLGEGYLPYDTTQYGTTVGKAVDWILAGTTPVPLGAELNGYWHHAEDYNNSGAIEGGEGNGQAIQFYSDFLYSNGITTPVVFELGQKLGKDTVIGGASPVSAMTYAELMQDIVDRYSWAQTEPNTGNFRGGWWYQPNTFASDNSTAQWGALPILYADAWGLGVPQYVRDELALWIGYIQNPATGGSGYTDPLGWNNVSKTGGLLLEFAVVGIDTTDANVQSALTFIDNRWNNPVDVGWNGNILNSYAMWATFKGLESQGFLKDYGAGPGENFPIGFGVPSAPGGLLIGHDEWDGAGPNPPPVFSQPGDWYSHYSDTLVNSQTVIVPDSTGRPLVGYWTGLHGPPSGDVISTGWYINILNAVGLPVPVQEITVAVDIKPTSCPNPLNTKGNGVLPVAILGTEDFDVTQVDPSTVLLEGVPALRWSLEDVTTPFTGEFTGDCEDCTTEGPDGYPDLTLKFDKQAVIAALNTPPEPEDPEWTPPTDSECRLLTLTGALLEEFGGTAISGVDVMRIQIRGKKNDVQAAKKGKKKLAVPTDFALDQNHPNPANPSTQIDYALPSQVHVTITLFNSSGQKVGVMVDTTLPAGYHSVTWNGVNASSGRYFYRMEAGDFVANKSLILLK